MKKQMNNGMEESGTTVIITGVKKQWDDKYSWYLGNCGDSRGILVRLKRASPNDEEKPFIQSLDENKHESNKNEKNEINSVKYDSY